MLKETDSKWEDMPCSMCKLNTLSGMNYQKGRDHVSIDAMEGDEGIDFNELHPLYEDGYKEDTSGGDYDVILLPLETLMHLNAILRTLEYKVRMIVEYKLTYPLETVTACARVLGMEPVSAHSYLNRAKKEHPILMYLLDKKRKPVKDLLKEQQEVDQVRYDLIEKRLDIYKNNHPDFYKKIQPLAHFFNLSSKELKKYHDQDFL